jgi:hypothetical protein
VKLAIVEKLRRAKALVAEGWVQGDSQKRIDGKMHYCAIGAMRTITHRSYAMQELFRMANNIEFISVWNDVPGRTKRQVLSAFNKAIRYAEKHEL